MRQFAPKNHHLKSATRIVRRSDGEIVGHIKPHGFYSYHSKASQAMAAGSFKRRRKSK